MLKTLDCFSNIISKIENLPHSLKKLYCHNNQVYKITNLPNHLTEFTYYGNNIDIVNLINNRTKTKPMTLKNIVAEYIIKIS
jgi:hypothetical protein